MFNYIVLYGYNYVIMSSTHITICMTMTIWEVFSICMSKLVFVDATCYLHVTFWYEYLSLINTTLISALFFIMLRI